MKLTALADVAGAGEKEKMSIAKFLTVSFPGSYVQCLELMSLQLSYVISPVLTFAVVGAIEAVRNATGQ